MDDPKLFADHMAYEAKAWQHAAKAVKLEEAGRLKEAAEEREKCKRWLRRAMEIERRMKAKNPFG